MTKYIKILIPSLNGFDEYRYELGEVNTDLGEIRGISLTTDITNGFCFNEVLISFVLEGKVTFVRHINCIVQEIHDGEE